MSTPTRNEGTIRSGVLIYRGPLSGRVYLARRFKEGPSDEAGQSVKEIVGKKEDITSAIDRFLVDEISRWGKCPHMSWSGDEGPVKNLGRMPRRWKCNGCGAIKVDEFPSSVKEDEKDG